MLILFGLAVLVKATVSPSGSIDTVPLDGTRVEVNQGLATSVTGQLVGVGMLWIVREPLSVIVTSWSKAEPSQSTWNVNVPVPPVVTLLTTRSPTLRTLVKATVSPFESTVTVPLVGVLVDVNRGSATS